MSHDSDTESSGWLAPVLALTAILIGWIALPVIDFACLPRHPPPPTKEELDRTIRRTKEFLEEKRRARELERQRRAREAEKTKDDKKPQKNDLDLRRLDIS